MKRRRRGLASLLDVADDVVGTLRRRQQSREPRVVVYDGEGHAHTLTPAAPGREEMLEAARALVELSGHR